MRQNTNPSWPVALCGMVVALSVVLMEAVRAITLSRGGEEDA